MTNFSFDPVNPLKAKLASGETIIGIWSLIPSPILAEIVGLAGLDFQILDMEHGVYDVQALDNSIRACESVGCSPLVRVPSVDQSAVQTALDLGAHGAIIPQIADYEAALHAVRCTKYAPVGVRGFNPFTRGGGYNPAEKKSKLHNDYGITIIIVESVGAYQDIDKILKIPDLDVVYLGVYDMSVALGHPGEVDHPLVKEFVEIASAKICSAGKTVGLMVKNREEVQRALSLGAQFLVYSVDTLVIHRAMSEAKTLLREVK